MDWDVVPKINVLKRPVGFVYKIFEIDTTKFYYGIKKFYHIKKLKPLKGMKNKRHNVVETDWRTYNTSSSIMKEKLKNNRNNYIKEIVKVCDSITEMKAFEAYLQLQEYLFGDWNKCYNEMINLRVRIRK